MKLEYRLVKQISDNGFNDVVKNIYKRPYNFQQQDGCQDRGVYNFSVPSNKACDEEMFDAIEEVVNGEDMGVKFDLWLSRDPNKPIPNQTDDYELELFWERNFYPDFHTVVNDLYEKGLIEAGDYLMIVDW